MSFHDDNDPKPPARRSDALWALARADYLAGGSAPEVCERHGLNLSTFRYQARIKGWRRADQVETDPDQPFVLRPGDIDEDDPAFGADLDRPPPVEGQWNGSRAPFNPEGSLSTVAEAYAEPQELADVAWLNAERAIRAGRVIEARGWTRIHRDLSTTCRNPPHRRAADAREDLLRTEAEMIRQRSQLDDLRLQVARAKADLARD